MGISTSSTRQSSSHGAVRGCWRTLATLVLATALAAGCGSKSIRPATDDSGISTRVRTALLNDPQLAANGISVTASNGVVVLSGRVQTPQERDRAVALARGTSGVTDVRSELAVGQP